jgi:adenosylcobinamide-GDP ribazoletransferase
MLMRGLLDDILNAFGLLTRLPLPEGNLNETTSLSRSVWAYPLVGAGVGALSALVWFAAQLAGLDLVLSAGMALASQILITGALHEDGLADFVDGLGGGRDREAKLAIMRDSRIGAYGVIALILVLGLRWSAIAGLALHSVLAGLICSALLGRLAIVALLALLHPARNDGLGALVSNPPRRSVIAAFVLSFGLVALQLELLTALFVLLAAGLAVGFVSILSKRQIGGYTGDVLGAGEQFVQTVVLIILAAMT